RRPSPPPRAARRRASPASAGWVDSPAGPSQRGPRGVHRGPRGPPPSFFRAGGKPAPPPPIHPLPPPRRETPRPGVARRRRGLGRFQERRRRPIRLAHLDAERAREVDLPDRVDRHAGNAALPPRFWHLQPVERLAIYERPVSRDRERPAEARLRVGHVQHSLI